MDQNPPKTWMPFIFGKERDLLWRLVCCGFEYVDVVVDDDRDAAEALAGMGILTPADDGGYRLNRDKVEDAAMGKQIDDIALVHHVGEDCPGILKGEIAEPFVTCNECGAHLHLSSVLVYLDEHFPEIAASIREAQ